MEAASTAMVKGYYNKAYYMEAGLLLGTYPTP